MALRRSLGLATLALLVTSGVVVAAHAQPTGLTSEALARGAWDRADRTDFLAALAGTGGGDRSDVFIVRATLTAGGTTNWHEHPGPSVVIVESGSLEVTEVQANGRCTEAVYGARSAFSHTPEMHTFTAGPNGAVFYVAYFIPAGSAALTHPGPLPSC